MMASAVREMASTRRRKVRAEQQAAADAERCGETHRPEEGRLDRFLEVVDLTQITADRQHQAGAEIGDLGAHPFRVAAVLRRLRHVDHAPTRFQVWLRRHLAREMRSRRILEQVVERARSLSARADQRRQVAKPLGSEFGLQEFGLGLDPRSHLLPQGRPRFHEDRPAKHDGRHGKQCDVKRRETKTRDPQQSRQCDPDHEVSGVGVRKV